MRQDIKQEKDKEDNKNMQNNKPMQDNKPIKDVKEIVRGFIDRNVVVVTRSKKTFSGKLESVTNYEILLTVSHQPVLIMKHAIDYIELASTSS